VIHYQLRCAHGHDFEGWFRDSAGFEAQARSGLLRCPSCGSSTVDRGLMAPAVRTARTAAPMPAEPGQAMEMPDTLRAGLQRLRAAIERDCENMGDRFADEAIRMHRGETEERGIYGNASERDQEALADAGVAVASIPWLKPAGG
jgi:hypothetical protein